MSSNPWPRNLAPPQYRVLVSSLRRFRWDQGCRAALQTSTQSALDTWARTGIPNLWGHLATNGLDPEAIGAWYVGEPHVVSGYWLAGPSGRATPLAPPWKISPEHDWYSYMSPLTTLLIQAAGVDVDHGTVHDACIETSADRFEAWSMPSRDDVEGFSRDIASKLAGAISDSR